MPHRSRAIRLSLNGLHGPEKSGDFLKSIGPHGSSWRTPAENYCPANGRFLTVCLTFEESRLLIVPGRQRGQLDDTEESQGWSCLLQSG